MGKKFTSFILLILISVVYVFAQETESPDEEIISGNNKKETEKILEISGEVKTGVFWEKQDVEGQEIKETAKMHNNDDAGPNQGRFRLNMHLLVNNIGMKVRFQQTAWSGVQPNMWDYAFAYGNFINDQLKVTIGKLGESPWSAGGPDIWKELDDQIGIRTEVKLKVLKGLNFGLVLNGWDSHNYFPHLNTLTDMLKETVFGIAYTHKYFHIRFSYRLDGESDTSEQQEGMSMMYRLEERYLTTVLKGFSIWANGWWRGIGEETIAVSNQNWLYIDYSPEKFSAQIRMGYDFGRYSDNDMWHTINTRVSFYYHILNFLSVGAAFRYSHDFGAIEVEGAPFRLMGIQPQIKFNFGSNAYISFVYDFQWDYRREATSADPILAKRQWFNLRTVYTF